MNSEKKNTKLGPWLWKEPMQASGSDAFASLASWYIKAIFGNRYLNTLKRAYSFQRGEAVTREGLYSYRISVNATGTSHKPTEG